MMENLVWKAYYHSMSGHEIRPFMIKESALDSFRYPICSVYGTQ